MSSLVGVATKDQDAGGLAVKKGDRLFLNIAHANVDVSNNDCICIMYSEFLF